MKTKHLFSAAMLAALFAACTNEELVTPNVPNVGNDGRATVKNVKFTFQKDGEGSDTRVIFDQDTKKYSWENGDLVGALLMDELNGTINNYRPFSDPEEWAKLTWLDKYTLSNYIHTDYKVTFNKADETWVTKEASLLEGNYFFAHPYDGYSSKRQLIHSIGGQTQKDGSIEATADAFGRNQYWIGYAQVKEGDKVGEVMNVEMTRVLAPIRFTIKMIGTQTYKVNKVVVQGADVRTLLTIDPTCGFNLVDGTTASSGYKGENGQGVYNLKPSGTDNKYFNYANYLSHWDEAMQEEAYESGKPYTDANNGVYNIDDVNNYDRFNALRAIVDVESVKGDEVQYAEMKYETEQELKANGANTINGVIFVNPDTSVTDLRMSIFTDKGVIRDIDLTKVNTEIKVGETTAITNKKIEKLTPTTSNTINIQVDDNSIFGANVMTVNNSDDLEQFINWNKGENRPYAAILANNATLTKKMVETLRAAKKSNEDNELIVTLGAVDNNPEARKLIIAEDVAADVFEFVNLNGGEIFDLDNDGAKENITSVDVDILGTVNLDSDKAIGLTDNSKTITVVKGAKLNIVKANTTAVVNIENYGEIAMAAGTSAKNLYIVNKEKAEMNIAGTLEFAKDKDSNVSENNGEITVAATGVLQGTTGANFTNKGKITNNGRIWNIVNDNVKTAFVYAAGLTNHFNSHGTNATIQLAALNTSVSGNADGGHILFEGSDMDLSKVTAAKVTDLVITDGYLRVENTAAGTVKTITVNENATVTIEGGTYSATGVWTPGSRGLKIASDAELNLSGNVTMKYLSNAYKSDVKMLKGTLNIDANVAAINTLTLGSKEAFTEFGAEVNVKKGATLAVETLSRDANVSTVKPVINNDGKVTATTYNDVTDGKITVNGDDVNE